MLKWQLSCFLTSPGPRSVSFPHLFLSTSALGGASVVLLRSLSQKLCLVIQMMVQISARPGQGLAGGRRSPEVFCASSVAWARQEEQQQVESSPSCVRMRGSSPWMWFLLCGLSGKTHRGFYQPPTLSHGCAQPCEVPSDKCGELGRALCLSVVLQTCSSWLLC